MKRTSRWANGLVGAMGVILAAGCVEGPTVLSIQQNQVPIVKDGQCTIPGAPSDVVTGRGVLDLAVTGGRGYELYPLLTNNAAQLGQGVEPNRIDVSAFEVELKAPPTIQIPWSAACPARFDYAYSAVLFPNASAGSAVEAVRGCHVALLRDLFKTGKVSSNLAEDVVMTLAIRARGSHGGRTIRSDWFEYPIRLCYGCLQTGGIVLGGENYNFPKVPPCASLPVHPFTGNPCNPAQDTGPILCCALDAAGTQLECPGIPRIIPVKM